MTYDSKKSLLLQLRDAAKVERDELTRFNMRTAADELDVALRAFKDAPNGSNLAIINGLWARGVRVLGFATAIDPNPGGAKMSVAA